MASSRGAPIWLLGMAALLGVSACAAKSSVVHTPPALRVPPSEVAVPEEADVVWSRLIRGLPAAGFTVTHQDVEVGIIEASLATQRPERYIDCGRSQRSFDPPLGDIETYEYEAAAGANYKLTNFEGEPLTATRDTLLDAIANIYVEAAEPATNVVVDARYDLRTVVTYHEVELFDSDEVTSRPITVTRELSFQTSEPGFGDEEISFCVSKGTLEDAILDLATGRGA